MAGSEMDCYMAAMTASHWRRPESDASSWRDAARCTPKLESASPRACQSWSNAMAAAPGCDMSSAKARECTIAIEEDGEEGREGE